LRKLVEFPGEEAVLRGWLMLPESAGPRPAVAMAHGFSATIDGMVADQYGDAFCDAGFAVLLYDHETFGRSGGAVRQHIDPWLQARGYRHALDYLMTVPQVDPSRIGLWGDSFSGAVASAVTAVDERVAALVAQVPAFGTTLALDDESIFAAMRTGMRERPPDVQGPGTTRPVVSTDQIGTPSHLTPLSAFHWFIKYGARHGTNWQNVATRVTRAARWNATACTTLIRAPALYLLSPDDEMPGAHPPTAVAAARRTPNGEIADIGGGHFGLLYDHEPEFARAVKLETEFLQRALG
jgi:hypothetical protein